MVAIATLPATNPPTTVPASGRNSGPSTMVFATSTGRMRRPRVVQVLGFMVLAAVVLAAAGFLVTAGPEPVGAGVPVSSAGHVVADGETMWSIAVDAAAAGEAAGYVERLVAVNGSATITPGQVLTLPRP